MSASKDDSVPCFQCLRKVVYDGADFENMCSMEIGSQKHCDQCPSDQACDPLPLCFLTELKRLHAVRETDFKVDFEWEMMRFEPNIDRWDKEATWSSGRTLHDTAAFLEECQKTMTKDDFQRLIEIQNLGFAVRKGILRVRKNALDLRAADHKALVARMREGLVDQK